MTTDELDEYLGRSVLVQMTYGATLTGRLVGGLEGAGFGAPYAIKARLESRTCGAQRATYAAIPSADAVESVRVIDQVEPAFDARNDERSAENRRTIREAVMGDDGLEPPTSSLEGAHA